jgi:hypothetical protein
MTCGTCGSGNTAYVAEAFANICTNCGTLVDAQQVELYVDSTNELDGQIGRSYYAGPSTLKGVYGNRSLAGQGNKELYDRNNKVGLCDLIDVVRIILTYCRMVPIKQYRICSQASSIQALFLALGMYLISR